MNRIFHYRIICALLLCVLCAWQARAQTSPSSGKHVADRVIAKINRDIVMQSDVERYKRRCRRTMGDNAEVPTSAALEFLFDSQLLKQLAAEKGYNPTESEISDRLEKQMADFKKAFGNQAAFEKAMKNAGYNEELLREDLRKDIRTDMQVQQAIGTRMRMDDNDVQAWVELQNKAGKATEELHVCRLGVTISEENHITKEDASAKLRAMMKKIQADNLNFADGLRKYVDQNDVKRGFVLLDDYGPMPANKLSSKVRDACKDLPEKSWTPPTVTGNAVSALYIESRRDARTIVFEDKYKAARESVLKDLRRKARLLIYPEEYRKQLPASYRTALGNPDIPPATSPVKP